MLALSIAALVSDRVREETDGEVRKDARALHRAAAPDTVGEATVKEAPPAPRSDQLASAAQAGVAVTEEKPSRFDDVRFDFDKSEVTEDGRRTSRPWPTT